MQISEITIWAELQCPFPLSFCKFIEYILISFPTGFEGKPYGNYFYDYFFFICPPFYRYTATDLPWGGYLRLPVGFVLRTIICLRWFSTTNENFVKFGAHQEIALWQMR